MKQSLFLTIIIVTLFALINANVVTENEPNYTNKRNIVYANNNKLDVYYDKNNISVGHPVVIYIHGGYWCEGNKDSESQIGKLLQKNGFVTIIPNYRLYPEVTNIDEMVNDVYSMIQWTVNNVEKYGGDLSEMTIVGFNAGAHIATMTLIKSALKMEVNGEKLSTLADFKHLILLNSPFTFGTQERLEFDIRDMRVTAKLVSELKYINKYADAKEGLFIGKPTTSYDIVSILNEQDDLSISSIGVEKITFVECDHDIHYPVGSSEEMMNEVIRVIDDVELVKQVYQGNYDYIISGVKSKDEEITQIFLNLINSA